MYGHQNEYDWFGCPMQHVYMIEIENEYGERPWAGSQMGRKCAFTEGLSKIDDDFVYRQEDFVFSELVKRAGYKEGKVTDTIHYHQTMRKPTPWARKVKGLHIDLELSHGEELRTWNMQARGIIKYLQPSNKWVTDNICHSLYKLSEKKELDWKEFHDWVEKTNPTWIPFINKCYKDKSLLLKMKRFFFNSITNIINSNK
jgi:hypothetical protein